MTSMSAHHSGWDEAGMSRSVGVVEQIILSEVHAGIDPRKILLVGFGQGATLALMVALTTLHDLGGVASLSGSLPRGPQAREVSLPPIHADVDLTKIHNSNSSIRILPFRCSMPTDD